MDEQICRLNRAIDFAIETNNAVFYKAIKVNQRIDHAKNVCVFGTGGFFEGYHGYLKRIDFVCDNNQEKSGSVISGYTCVSPDKLKELDDVVVIIMVGNYKKVQEQLNEMQIENYLFTDLFMNVYTTYHDAGWFEAQREKVLAAYQMFEDTLSKECFVESICHRIAPFLAQKTFHEIESENEYFSDELYQLTDHETYVDVGAFDGDTVENFVKAVGEKYNKIYAFELDKRNYERMKIRLEKYKDEKISLFNYGCSDAEKEVRYKSGETGSNVTAEGDEEAKLVKIDNYVQGEATLLKMDIEGAEIAALEGARKVIGRNTPKLIISAYHRLEDLWDIPLKIKEINSNYKLYLRHHSPMVWDTDCYALSN